MWLTWLRLVWAEEVWGRKIYLDALLLCMPNLIWYVVMCARQCARWVNMVKGKGNPAFICRTIEYIHQWYMVEIHASFIHQEGKTEWVPKIWESSAHGGHHIASLLRKTDVDVMQCGQQPAWWLITPSPIPEAARCQLLLRAGQLRYLNAPARKLPPKLHCQEMINNT